MKFYDIGDELPNFRDITQTALNNERKRKALKYRDFIQAVIDKLNECIMWASFGMIVNESNNAGVPDSEPPYVWDTYYPKGAEISLEKAVTSFVKEVTEKSAQYLLIGNIGEEIFSKPAEVPCICLDYNNITKNKKVIRASDSTLLNEVKKITGVDLTGDSYVNRWEAYIKKSSEVTNNHKNPILYIPITIRGYAKGADLNILGGGLVLCVKESKLEDVLAVIPDLQLYLRWFFASLFLNNAFLGVSQTSIALIDFMRKNNWFKQNRCGSEVTVLHSYSNVNAADKLWACDQLKAYLGIVGDYTCDLHETLKEFRENDLNATTITPAQLYILAVSACIQNNFEIMFNSELVKRYDAENTPIKFRFRTRAGGRSYLKILHEAFYEYVCSAVNIDKKHKNSGEDTRLLEKIDVAGAKITLTFANKEYASKLSKKISGMFVDGREILGNPHNASGPLGRFILWSGCNFNNEKCENHTEICHGHACLSLYDEREKSVLEIIGD